MKKPYILKLLLLTAMLSACTVKPQAAFPQTVAAAAETESKETQAHAKPEPAAPAPGNGPLNEDENLLILVQGNEHPIVFELNGSPASKSLYNQLPLSIEVEDYSSNEKIFYPPEDLEIGDTPLTQGGGEGGLAYFSSWGDVVMYYGDYGPYSGLYDLGTAISGGEWIEALSGEIVIEPAETLSKAHLLGSQHYSLPDGKSGIKEGQE